MTEPHLKAMESVVVVQKRVKIVVVDKKYWEEGNEVLGYNLKYLPIVHVVVVDDAVVVVVVVERGYAQAFEWF